MNNHNTSDLLHAFLDGELELSQEQPLFSELASSGDLRSEMRELLAMRSAVQQDTEAFTPPPSATSTIFNSLGFSLPAGTTGGAAIASEVLPSAIGASSAAATVGAASWWSKLWLPSVTALVGAGITFWLLNWGYSSNLTEMASAHANELQKIRSENAAQLASQADSFRNQLQSASEAKVIVRTEKVYYPKIEYRYTDRNTNSESSQIPTDNNSAVNSSEPSVSLGMAENKFPSPIQYSSGGNSLFQKRFSMYFASPISQDNTLRNSHDAMTSELLEREFLPKEEAYYPHWSAKLGGVASTLSSTPIPTTASPTDALNNLNLQLMYSLSEDILVGLKFGREAFPLQYNGSIAGRTFTREQYSPVYWGGIAAQYQPSGLSFFGGVQPYVSVFGGSSEISGLLLRFEPGLQLSLSPRFSISAGFDISRLSYQFQGTGFSTVKTGINSGIIIHF
jgi:hypothetical protein